MQVVILIVTVFLFGTNPPKSIAIVTPDAETCATVGADAKDHFVKVEGVRAVVTACVTMRGEDQT
jgi:hypothetical protein